MRLKQVTQAGNCWLLGTSSLISAIFFAWRHVATSVSLEFLICTRNASGMRNSSVDDMFHISGKWVNWSLWYISRDGVDIPGATRIREWLRYFGEYSLIERFRRNIAVFFRSLKSEKQPSYGSANFKSPMQNNKRLYRSNFWWHSGYLRSYL